MERIRKGLENAKRPLVVAGNGIRLAGCLERFRAFISLTRLPFVTTWGGADLIETEHELNLGIIGMCGQPGANSAVSKADFLLALGTHLSIPQTGNPPEMFAPNAAKAIVDIDQDQLDNLTWRPDISVCSHLRDFFDAAMHYQDRPITENWYLGSKSANVMPHIGSYAFNRRMTAALPAGSIMVVDGGGTALYTGFQSSIVKQDSRLICSSSMSAMGSGLPEAVGACIASNRRLTTCLIGDGSFMFNMQELATISHHELPIKIFIISNDGYLAIRHTQDAFREGRHYGSEGHDLSFVDIPPLAAAFLISSYQMNWDDELPEGLFDDPLPAIIEVHCPFDQQMVRQKFIDGKPQPLSDMEIPSED